jgi:hypothetical protein
MLTRPRALVIGVLLAFGAGAAPMAAHAQAQPGAQAGTPTPANDPLKVLIDQGKYWQAHKRGDLAEQAWQKVLRIDPKQPDALYGMGIVLVDRKDGSGAQQYLARLRAVAPDYPSIGELARRLGVSRKAARPRPPRSSTGRRSARSRPIRSSRSSTTRRSAARRKAGKKRGAASSSWRANIQKIRVSRSRTRSSSLTAKRTGATASRGSRSWRTIRPSARRRKRAGVRRCCGSACAPPMRRFSRLT